MGIRGNELADAAAKQAASSRGSHCVKVPVDDFKFVFKSFYRTRWQDHWSGLNNNFKLKSIRPSVHPWTNCPGMDRRSSIILTRLRIGHTYLTHKFLMASGAERQAPLCLTCNINLTVKHILRDCPSYRRQRMLCGLGSLSLTEMIGENGPFADVFKFLKAIGLFYDF